VLCLVVSAWFVIGQRTRLGAAADVILWAAGATIRGSAWTVVSDSTAAGGSRVANADARAPKSTAPLASPASYFELSFNADARTAYRLWIRGKAQGNSYLNDSAYVQFSDSVTSSGAATWRIGTTSAIAYVLEDASGAGVSGWGWQDNAYGAGALGPPVYFQSTGTHRIRIQVREDGLSIDQIVLSPATYLNTSPGATKNDTTILTGGSPSPPSVSTVRQPYLQQVTDRSAIIVWASREAGSARAVVGGRTFTAASIFYPASTTGLSYSYYQHEAPVTGLSASTSYRYDVYVGNTRLTPGTDQFRTAPTPGTGIASFVVIGDSGTGSAEQKALASLMKGESFDIMLHAGDIVYGNSGGTGDASHLAYQNWFFDIYRDMLRRKPFFPSMGNHDSRASTNWGRAYLNVYVLADEAGTGPHADHAERYYSFDYGPVHFVALDTEMAFLAGTRRDAQLAWLAADLASTTQPWKVAVFHKAPYSSGAGHGSNLDVRAAFGPLFERYGVHFVLSAHDHDYERLVPWRESTDLSRQAVVYFVSGGGGAPLYTVGRSTWTATSRSAHHYLKGYISGCVAHFKAVNTAGAEIDRYSFDRCAQASDTAAPSVAFVNPTNGATVTGSVTVRADASDDTRVEKVDLRIDGVLRSIDLTAPYAFTWNTTSETAGAHTLELRAYDIDGRSATKRISVTKE
jgi:hypothetical protein